MREADDYRTFNTDLSAFFEGSPWKNADSIVLVCSTFTFNGQVYSSVNSVLLQQLRSILLLRGSSRIFLIPSNNYGYYTSIHNKGLPEDLVCIRYFDLVDSRLSIDPDIT